MKLLFLRHGHAEERDKNLYPDDSLRPLTKSGRSKIVKIAQGIENIKVVPDIILSSPFKRAIETAEIVHKTLKLKKGQLVSCEHLIPAGQRDALISKINRDFYLTNVMIVGHEPDMTSLISVLISGEISADIRLKKGGLCCLSVESLAYSRCAAMEWLLTPSFFVSFSG